MIENNNIHNCGKLPAQNGDHGIYIDDATGTIVRGNWIHNNADRGVQIYPNGDNSLIIGNIIDSNGEGVIFGGAGGQTSDNNVVEHNIITNSQLRRNVESYWGSGPVGVGNVARNNCIKGASDPTTPPKTDLGSRVRRSASPPAPTSSSIRGTKTPCQATTGFRATARARRSSLGRTWSVDGPGGQESCEFARAAGFQHPLDRQWHAHIGEADRQCEDGEEGRRAKKKAHPAEAKARA